MTLKISKWLFLLLIVSLPLIRPFNTRLFGLLVPYTDFIFLFAFAFWLVSLIRREASLKLDRIYIFLFIYGLALTASTILSINPVGSFYKLLGELYLFALAVLSFNLAYERGFLRQAALAWLIGTGLTAAAAMAGFILFYAGLKTPAENYFLSHFGSLPAGNYPRIHALFANANMMCNYLNVSLMLALAAEHFGWLKKLWAKTLQAATWLAALFTFSAGLGGMFLSAGVWYWLYFRQKGQVLLSRAALLIGLASAAFFLASVLISPDTANTDRDFFLPFSDAKVEPSVRVLVWESAVETFAAQPFFGKGTGADVAAVSYVTLSGDRQFLLDAHNMWLNVLGQAGLFGLATFALVVGYMTYRCRFAAFDGGARTRLLTALSCAFLGAFLYQGLFGSFENARHLWILIGFISAAAGRSAAEEPEIV